MTHILWRAADEHSEVVDVLPQEHRDKGAAKHFFRRLINDYKFPEGITNELRGYGAAIRELPELAVTERIKVSAARRQSNLIEQSHRSTREQERQQRQFRDKKRAQGFLFTHAEVNGLFRHARASTPARLR